MAAASPRIACGAFDSHCHFERSDDVAALVREARSAGLSGVLATGGSAEANETALSAHSADPDFVFAAVGFEQGEEGAVSVDQALETVRAAAPSIACVGEIGLDYSHGESEDSRRAQRALFAAQVSLAAELRLPCSVHSRGAEADVAAILAERLSPELAREGRAGALHCFTGPASFAEKLVPLGMSFGLSGILTFEGADALRRIVPGLPRDRLLVETDSPFLAPVPHRGERCRPALVAHTASRLAAILGMSGDEAAALCRENAMRIFAPHGGRA